MTITSTKKLIEVALPLEKINAASAREKSIRHGHPSNLHRWWARRPLAAARAVIFAQMVDDPSAHPDLFPTEETQEAERQRLFRLIEKLVLWENTTNEDVLKEARDEIWKSWRRTCAENQDHPRAAELFNPDQPPAFHDPFAGGGTIPLEAQRLGLESYASDLNPVAVLINKAMIEIPPRFAGRPPVNPDARKGRLAGTQQWRGAQGLAEDVRYYGQWMRDEAEKRIGHLYPKIEVTAEMAQERPDLQRLIGQRLTVISWIWARTVKSPNPAFRHVDVPLVSSFLLANRTGKEAFVEPILDSSSYYFVVRVGKPKNMEAVKDGTKLSRGANFRCLMSDAPIEADYIKSEGRAGRMGARLMAIVAEGTRGRIYLSPTEEQETTALQAHAEWKPETELAADPRALWTPPYGLTTFGDLFTSRQLVTLNTLSDLVQEALTLVESNALASGMTKDTRSLNGNGSGATAYAEAVCVYLALILSKTSDSNNSLCPWEPVAQCSRQLFGRQAIPMLWDYAEANPLHNSSGGFTTNIDVSLRSFISLSTYGGRGFAYQANASHQNFSQNAIISTDPPYYDNIGYADLSDFFFVWLRRSLKPVFPELFSTLAVPKADELVATPYRHGSKEKAEKFFLSGMTQVLYRLAKQAHPVFPLTIYYAFKQSETRTDAGISSTGWETFLGAVIQAGLSITGTWPVRTEMTAALKELTNSLASSIVLVCRPRSLSAHVVTRRDFRAALKDELPSALRLLQAGNIAPVDLAQAAIGPGMAIFTRYGKVLDSSGEVLEVREALALINEVLDEVLAEQEGDFDADTRWALAWFDQFGFAEGDFGTADMLSKAKVTSVGGMVEAGIVAAYAGKVRLLRTNELPAEWNPDLDFRLTVWEMVHHLVRVLEQGEQAAAALLAKLGPKADVARELAYRLYSICDRRKRAAEALAYNGLVQSWPEMARLASENRTEIFAQTNLLGEG